MDDVNAFFVEQEQRMNLPDEDVDTYFRARLEYLRKESNATGSHAVRAQSHGLENGHGTSAFFNNSGLFRASPAESISSEPSRPRKRKSAELQPFPKEKKPRLHDTSRVSVLPPTFSHSDNIECSINHPNSIKSQLNISANSTSQPPSPRDITAVSPSPDPDTDCPHKHPQYDCELPVAQSRFHITKPVVKCEENIFDPKHLPPSTTQTHKSKVAILAARHATGDQEPTNDRRAQAPVTRQEHSEGASGKTDRLSFTHEATPQFDLPGHLAADTSHITSPSNSLVRNSGCSDIVASDADGAQSSSRPTVAKLPKVRRTVNSSRAKADVSKEQKGQKSKGKPALVTPLQYAQKLLSNIESGKKRKSDYLKGKRFFYVGGDMQYASTKTRGRMDYIVKHGGTLVPSYDPVTVTHIVTDATTPPTLRALGLKSLKSIPDHIPTVKWSWVISGYGRSARNKKELGEEANSTKGKAKAIDDDDDDEGYLDFEFLHAAFPGRIDAGRSWLKKGQGRQMKPEGHVSTSSNVECSGDVSRISSFTEAHPTEKQRGPKPKLVVLPPAPLNLLPTPNEASRTAVHAVDRGRSHPKLPSNTEDDPLAEFYEIAKAERDQTRDLGESELDESDDGEDFVEYPTHVPRRGFTCDRKEPQQRECVNQDIIDKLNELMELHKAKLGDEDRWRVYSYSKCVRALRNYPKKIRSYNEARSITGVGAKTAQKIMEIIETGNLRRISYEKTDDVAAINLFQGIYGVGRQISCTWYNNGCRTLDDIRARKGGIKLSPAQEIGLRFYDDINSRMPRSEAETIFNMIKPIALELDEHLYIDIMGSFRRGKATCGDIDILITRPTSDRMTHAGLLPELLARLYAQKILTEDLALPDDFSALELCYRGLCKLPGSDAKRRRIDILCVPWENRGAALLYYTGDDIFNRAMRMKANVLGYSLNQRGLYAGVVRDPRNRRVKTNAGNIVASETEEEIFNILSECQLLWVSS